MLKLYVSAIKRHKNFRLYNKYLFSLESIERIEDLNANKYVMYMSQIFLYLLITYINNTNYKWNFVTKKKSDSLTHSANRSPMHQFKLFINLKVYMGFLFILYIKIHKTTNYSRWYAFINENMSKSLRINQIKDKYFIH